MYDAGLAGSSLLAGTAQGHKQGSGPTEHSGACPGLLPSCIVINFLGPGLGPTPSPPALVPQRHQ